ncbi:unnamed protein product [Diamesa tonsa]
MHTIKDYDHVVYEQAKEPTYTVGDYVTFYITFVYRIAQILIYCLYDYIIKLVRLPFFWYFKPKNIGGQLALVTGGGNGLGREIALRLAKEGCNIVIVDLDLRGAQNTAKEIEEKCKVTALAYKVDVSDYEAVERLKVDIEKSIGTVDILVNNAGNVYGATKAGVENFMEALHDELCVDDHDEYVKCTTVYPTFINTSQNLASFLDVFGVSFGRRFTAEFIANETINAVLNNKRNQTIPSSCSTLNAVLITPDRVMKFAKRNIFPVKTFFNK